MESYLLNRKLIIIINYVIDQECIIDYVIPQRRVLGPILFILLHINLVSDLNLYGLVVSYYDDTYLPIFHWQIIEGVHYWVIVGVNKVFQYLCDNNLTLNESKTMFLTFTINKTLISLN